VKPLGQLEQHLVGMFIGWFYEKFVFLFCRSEVHERKKKPKGDKKKVLEDHPIDIPSKFGFNSPCDFREKD
jgi:hypothetical protein